jgi:hypothetical protein
MQWIKRILIIFSALVLLEVVGGVGFVWYASSDIREREHVSDEVLINNLESHTERYQRLIAMFREDHPVAVVHPDWISPDYVITEDRWAEYQSLFDELELDAGMRAWGESSIWFIATAQGLVTGGSSKGYMYKPERHTPVFPSLDEIPKSLQANVKGYRKINDDWYIVLVWDD